MILVALILHPINTSLKLYYWLFGRFILYPLMGWLARRIDVRFLNFGYLPIDSGREGRPTSVGRGAGNKDDVIMKHVRKFLPTGDLTLAHCLLYEKALSMCEQYYPQFPEGARLLEVGCGLGGGMGWLRKAHPEFIDVVGVDKVASREGVISATAEELPEWVEHFDVVINIESSHAYSDVNRFLANCYRVLKPGGHLCWADLREVEKMPQVLENAAGAGFERLAFEMITPQVIKGIHATAARYDKLMEEVVSGDSWIVDG